MKLKHILLICFIVISTWGISLLFADPIQQQVGIAGTDAIGGGSTQFAFRWLRSINWSPTAANWVDAAAPTTVVGTVFGLFNSSLIGACDPTGGANVCTTGGPISSANGDAITARVLGVAQMSFNGTTFDRVRSGNVGDNTNLGIQAVGIMAANPNTNVWNRIRDANAGDGIAGNGFVMNSPGLINGPTFDRQRAANTDAQAATGIAASGNMIFNGTNWDRLRSSGQLGSLKNSSYGSGQGGTLFNTDTTGAANTAVVATIPAAAGQQGHIYTFTAFCSAGTSNLTIADGATTIFNTPATEVTTARDSGSFTPGLTGTTGNAMTVTLATCGVGNTGTLAIQADRF